MRVLSIRQPWAWLVVNGHKDIENRDWPTNVRGDIGIHAGKAFDAEGYEWVQGEFPYIAMPKPEEFDRGGLVGVAVLADCVSESDSPWFFGEYGFVLHFASPVEFIPMRGQLGFFAADVAFTRKPTPTRPEGQERDQ